MVVSTLTIPLTNGGTGGAIFVFLGTAVGMGFVIASMAEMASMAPTSGGQYHWVSEFAPCRSVSCLGNRYTLVV
jgi:choline transport protein